MRGKIHSEKRKVVQLTLARKIAEALFTNGFNERAVRLRLEMPDGKYGGGWGFEPAVDIITKTILGE